MHLTGPLRTAIIIVYILLMVFETLHSAPSMNKLASTTIKSTTMTASTCKQRTPSQMTAVKRVISHLRNARRDIKKQCDVFLKFYAKEQMLLRGVFNYESLPKEHFKWFDIHVRHFDKHKKVSLLFPLLLHSLKTFQSTFREMLTFDLNVHHTVSASCDRHKERLIILEKIANSSNATCIEVETEINYLRLSTQLTVNVTQDENGSKWNSNPDYTTTMVQDWGVITTYYRFLKDWIQITGHIYYEFCVAKNSTNHRCHKLLKSDPLLTPPEPVTPPVGIKELHLPKAKQYTSSL